MTRVSHQTIKLSRGKHASPDTGACVMELASMLAGERFSDHPASVSKVIAAFLRGYNDLVDDVRRQDLYEYASRTVGTAASHRVEEARALYLLSWAEDAHSRNAKSSLLRRLIRPRMSRGRRSDPEAIGAFAVRAVGEPTEAMHREVLALVDQLIALGERPADTLVSSAETLARAWPGALASTEPIAPQSPLT